jgi:hypothetical protein
LNDTNSLGLVGIFLATESVIVDFNSKALKGLVDALHMLRVRMNTTCRVRHRLGGTPSLIRPVSGMDQLKLVNKNRIVRNNQKSSHKEHERYLSISDVRQHELGISFQTTHNSVHRPRAIQ